MKRLYICASSVLFCSLVAHAGQLNKVVDLHRASYAPPLTGTLTNPGWRDASVFTRFHMVKPQSGHPPSERTAGYVMYDSDNLYVGIRMFDRQADLIKIDAATKVDLEKDDWAAFAIDASEAHHGATYFMVTPGNTGSNGTLDANGGIHPAGAVEWTSAARRIPGGWAAELKIPLKSIPFEVKGIKLVGINVIRHIGRNGEEDQMTVPSDPQSNSSQFVQVSIKE